ncbi:MAG: hypothetical protein WAV21_01455 [Minisyncoccia bacterium]
MKIFGGTNMCEADDEPQLKKSEKPTQPVSVPVGQDASGPGHHTASYGKPFDLDEVLEERCYGLHGRLR